MLPHSARLRLVTFNNGRGGREPSVSEQQISRERRPKPAPPGSLQERGSEASSGCWSWGTRVGEFPPAFASSVPLATSNVPAHSAVKSQPAGTRRDRWHA